MARHGTAVPWASRGCGQAAAGLLLLDAQKNQNVLVAHPAALVPPDLLRPAGSRPSRGFPLRDPGASSHAGGPHAWVPPGHSRHTHGVGGAHEAHRPCVCVWGGGSPGGTAVCWQREAPGARRRCLMPTQGRTTAPSRATPPPGAGSPQNPARAAGRAAGTHPSPLPKAAEPRVSCHSAFCPADHCEKSRPGDRNT